MSAEVVKVAFPLLIVPEPSKEAPFLNVTAPVIVPEADDVTFAVNTTACLNLDGFAEADTAVRVSPSTTCFSAADELGKKLASPAYDTVME